MSKKILSVVLAMSVLAAITYSNLNLEMCYFSQGEEEIRHFFSMAAGVIIILLFLLYAQLTSKKNGLLIVFIFPLVGSTFFSSVYIHKKSVHYLNDFNGEVTKKYISNNHAAKLFSVNERDHGATKSIWGIIEVGDIVSKNECSNNITINGKVYAY